MNVYLIPGLAADQTIFRHLRLPQGYEAVYVDWIPPLPNETLAQYAQRLAQQINTTKPFGLIGLSFGGMLAVEIANMCKPVFTILISSVASVQQLPQYYRVAGRLRLHKILPVAAIQHAAILKRFFTNESTEDKKLLKGLIRKSDAHFIKWALHAILNWESPVVSQNLVHIHGTHDGILPARFTKPSHLIAKGGHLMVLTQAEEINQIVADILAEPAAGK